MKKLLVILLTLAMVLGAFAGCKKDKDNSSATGGDDGGGDGHGSGKQGVYNTFTVVMPGNWNDLTYEDNNDVQILDNISGAFFEYDYKFDESKGGKFNADGTINADAIVPGDFTVNYSAATALTDVTASVDSKWGYTDEQKADGGYAWKITLRHDLKWDDGTPINAKDFVYSMQQQLDPDFLNMRANTYYSTLSFLLKTYFSAFLIGVKVLVPVTGVEGKDYKSVREAMEDGADLEINMGEFFGANGALKVTSYNGEAFDIVLDYDNRFSGDWAKITDDQLYFDIAYFEKQHADFIKDGKVDTDKIKAEQLADLSEYVFSAKAVFDTYLDSMLEVGKDAESCVQVRVDNKNKGFKFEDVGIYAESDYDLVVCMNKPIMMKKDDGSLSYLAAYNFSRLPLVKKDLYEKCKIAPTAGSTLWTTNYNSSLETSASWGPYKLTSFQSGKSYVLSRNDNWYGYSMEENKNQYNVTKIVCEKIEKPETQWMGFLNGTLDEVGLDLDHKNDYRNSKYTKYAPGIGTFGMQLQGNLNALKSGGRNNGILAIRDFRKAISLSLNRDDYNAANFTSHKSCFGIMGPFSTS